MLRTNKWRSISESSKVQLMIWSWHFERSPLRSWKKQVLMNSRSWLFMRLDCDILMWVHTRWISGRIISSAQATGASTKESTQQMLRKCYSGNSSIKSQSKPWSASSRYPSLVHKIIRTIIKSDQTARKPLSMIAKLYPKKIQGSKQGHTHHTLQDENFSSYRCSFS